MLGRRFPDSAPIQVPVFFTAVEDLSKPWDTTRAELKKIKALARQNVDYDTQLMQKCVSLDWRDQKDCIMGEHLRLYREKAVQQLGHGENDYFTQTTKLIVEPLKCEFEASRLKPVDWNFMKT